MKNLYPERKDLLVKLYGVDTFEPFGIYEIDNGYIVHSELEIYKITEEGDIVWSFSGNDIFAGLKADDEYYISIDEGRIRLRDFNDDYYILDLNGNLLESSLNKKISN